MRDFDKHYGYAESVNRRARVAVVVLLLLGGFWAVTAGGDEPETLSQEVLGAQLGIDPQGVDVVGTGDQRDSDPPSTTIPTPPIGVTGELPSGKTAIPSPTVPTTSTTVLAASTTTTTSRPATTTTKPPTTTTKPPTTTTTVPPTTTTTTTRVPPTTTTTTTVPPTTTTTTVPPTTTTTVPPTTTTTTVPPTTTTTTLPPASSWFAILDATVACADDGPVITWFVYDPRDDWSDGWQLVIDGDSRGLFAPGTVVTANGGPAVAAEGVLPGSHTLVVERHWETIGSGRNPRGYGANSLTILVDDGACG